MSNSHSYTTKADGADANIRPSASICLLNPLNQILLVQRTASASSFANTHVFPGGNLDKTQDSDSYELCAIRELFEEANILLTTTPPPSSITSAQLDDVRKGIHSGKIKFTEWLAKTGLEADINRLRKFTTWITPPTMKKRYNTQMYLALLPTTNTTTGDGVNKEAEQGKGGKKKEEILPKHDGGVEIISTSYHTPTSALNLLHEGKIIMFPPQAYLLSRLAEFIPQVNTDDVSIDEIEEQRKKVVEWLDNGEEKVGGFVFRPRPEGRTKDGRVVLGYGPGGDQRRRTLLKVGKDGMPKDIHIVSKEEAEALIGDGAKI